MFTQFLVRIEKINFLMKQKRKRFFSSVALDFVLQANNSIVREILHVDY